MSIYQSGKVSDCTYADIWAALGTFQSPVRECTKAHGTGKFREPAGWKACATGGGHAKRLHFFELPERGSVEQISVVVWIKPVSRGRSLCLPRRGVDGRLTPCW